MNFLFFVVSVSCLLLGAYSYAKAAYNSGVYVGLTMGSKGLGDIAKAAGATDEQIEPYLQQEHALYRGIEKLHGFPRRWARQSIANFESDWERIKESREHS